MNIPINLIGNFEIEHNTLKYRQPIKEFATSEISEIERSIKKRAKELEKYPYYLNPFDIQTLNSFVALYYDVKHFNRFDVIRQLDFKDKLILFTSLIEIMKNKDVKILWERHNFLLDLEEREFRVILYETDTLQIHDETDPFEATKNLILMSLTTLNMIYAKPKRTDFIDQDEDIIKFAETILKIDDERDLEDYIESMRLEYEYMETDNKESSNQPKKKAPVKIKKPKTKKKQTNNQKQQQKKNDILSKRNILIAVGLLVALILNTIDLGGANTDKENVSATGSVAGINEDSEDNTFKDKTYNQNESELILEAYRSTLVGKHKEALNLLEEIGFTNLNEEDQEVMLRVYEDNEQYAHVIELAPERAKEIVNELVALDEREKIYNIHENVSNPYVAFEVHYFDREWEKLLTYKDSVDLNGRKEEQIFNAFMQLQKYDEAEKFAKDVGNPDLIKQLP